MQFFLHLPRSGSTTVRSIVARQYPEEAVYTIRYENREARHFAALPEDRRRAVRMIVGHKPSGFDRDLGVEADYLTLLRHPVERVVSYYHWIVAHPGNDLYGAARG